MTLEDLPNDLLYKIYELKHKLEMKDVFQYMEEKSGLYNFFKVRINHYRCINNEALKPYTSFYDGYTYYNNDIFKERLQLMLIMYKKIRME